MPFNITIAHDSITTHSSSRSSSPITDDGEDSSGTGVRVSPTSAVGSQEYTDSLEETEGWVLPVYPDEIGPSDSASRPRTSNQHRPLVEATRRETARRQPSRRQVGHDRVHHSHQRAHRPPPPIAPESVDPNEEWQAFYGRGPPQHPARAYAHWGHVAANPGPNYAPSHSSGQAYSPFPTSSLNPPTQQLVPFASPTGGYGYSHYQAAAGGSAPGYFPPPHHGAPSIGNHMAAHGGAPYSGQEMVPHPSAAYYPYGLQGYSVAQPMAPPAIYHYPTVYSPPSTTPPPPVDNSKDDEKFARLEKILMDQKAEQDAKEAAAKKAAEDQAAEAIAKKKIADEIAAAASAAAAAATSEAEKKAAEEAAKNKAAAEKAAEEKAAADKAAAEKAAEEKAAADKAAAEKAAAEKAVADKAAEEKAAADKAAAEAVAAAAAAATPPPPPPPPEEKKKPIKFKDAVGRKFSFPFHLCNTWMGMEDLIRQAFLHVEVIGPHVAEGHYDLVGPNGEIILPQVWETMIEPDWIITMHMWPMPEPPPPKAEEPPPAEPPPPEAPPPPPAPDPVPESIVIVPPDPKKKKPQTRLTPFQVWAGGKAAKKSLKVLKKPEEAIQHDILCRVM